MLGGGYSATGLLRGWIGRRTIARAAAAHRRQQLEAQVQAQAQAHTAALARSHLNPRSFSSHDGRLHSCNMLSAAVNRHNASTAASKPLDQLFSSSPPAQQQSQKSSVLSTASKNSKSINGIKRTHSGLAKTFSNTASFDDEQNQPVVCAVPEVTNSEYFDADDFDDDFDIDDLIVEEPKAKKPTPRTSKNTISYPTLPKITAPQHSAFHPTLPKRQ
ncbi:hypothetical protein KCU94_g22106, partial [Aureobasidium melanogenum]